MITGSVAVRYAKSLYNLARERGIEEKIKADAVFLKENLENLPELKDVLSMPTIKGTKKLLAFKAIFSGKIDDLTLSFIELVFKNNREESLYMMVKQVIERYKKDKGIKSVLLTSATKLDEKALEVIKKVISDTYQSDIELETTVDESIIGGFIVKIEDKQYNASVKSKLQELRQNIIS